MPIPPKDVKTVSTVGPSTQNLNPTKVKSTAQGRMSDGFLGSRGGLTSGLATTATNLFGGFVGKIVDDTDPTTVESPADVSTQVEGFFGNPGSKLFDGVLGFLSPILQGLTGGLSGIAQFIAGLFAIRWDQVDTHGQELGDLQSRTQYLEGVIGFAHSYATNDLSLTIGETKRPMTNQIGPAVGVQFTGGGFTLQSRGLWVADAHQTFDTYLIGAKDIWLGVRVFAPDGSLYAQRYSHSTEDAPSTLNVHLPFTTPAAGYRVEMWVHAAIGRGVWGGSANAGMSVFKESSETS
jgi:hypothetical protein